MARSTDSTFKAGAVGVPQIASDFDKFAVHATPRFAIGHKIEDHDGAVYRYSHFGADTNRGVLVSQDISESSQGDSDNAIVASASAATVTDGTKGSKYVQITASNVTVDQFAGGKFITSDDAGEGYTYDIVGNTASDDPAAECYRIQLKQPLQVAVTSATDFIIVGNKYSNLEIATNATDNFPAGVTCSNMDVSEQAWGWIQTKGLVGILTAGTSTAGEQAQLSTVTSGAVSTASNPAEETFLSTNTIIGSCIIAGDTTGHGAFYINLE